MAEPLDVVNEFADAPTAMPPPYIDKKKLGAVIAAVQEGRPAPPAYTYKAMFGKDQAWGLDVKEENLDAISQQFQRRFDASEEQGRQLAQEMMGTKTKQMEMAQKVDEQRNQLMISASQGDATAAQAAAGDVMAEQIAETFMNPIDSQSSMASYLNKMGYDQDAHYSKERSMSWVTRGTLAGLSVVDQAKSLQDRYPDYKLKRDDGGRLLYKRPDQKDYAAVFPENEGTASNFISSILFESPKIAAAVVSDVMIAKRLKDSVALATSATPAGVGKWIAQKAIVPVARVAAIGTAAFLAGEAREEVVQGATGLDQQKSSQAEIVTAPNGTIQIKNWTADPNQLYEKWATEIGLEAGGRVIGRAGGSLANTFDSNLKTTASDAATALNAMRIDKGMAPATTTLLQETDSFSASFAAGLGSKLSQAKKSFSEEVAGWIDGVSASMDDLAARFGVQATPEMKHRIAMDTYSSFSEARAIELNEISERITIPAFNRFIKDPSMLTTDTALEVGHEASKAFTDIMGELKDVKVAEMNSAIPDDAIIDISRLKTFIGNMKAGKDPVTGEFIKATREVTEERLVKGVLGVTSDRAEDVVVKEAVSSPRLPVEVEDLLKADNLQTAGQVRHAKTVLGEYIKSNGLTADISQANLSKLYGAMWDTIGDVDMKASAAAGVDVSKIDFAAFKEASKGYSIAAEMTGKGSLSRLDNWVAAYNLGDERFKTALTSQLIADPATLATAKAEFSKAGKLDIFNDAVSNGLQHYRWGSIENTIKLLSDEGSVVSRAIDSSFGLAARQDAVKGFQLMSEASAQYNKVSSSGNFYRLYRDFSGSDTLNDESLYKITNAIGLLERNGSKKEANMLRASVFDKIRAGSQMPITNKVLPSEVELKSLFLISGGKINQMMIETNPELLKKALGDAQHAQLSLIRDLATNPTGENLTAALAAPAIQGQVLHTIFDRSTDFVTKIALLATKVPIIFQGMTVASNSMFKKDGLIRKFMTQKMMTEEQIGRFQTSVSGGFRMVHSQVANNGYPDSGLLSESDFDDNSSARVSLALSKTSQSLEKESKRLREIDRTIERLRMSGQ